MIPHDCLPFAVHFTAVTDTRRTVTIISTGELFGLSGKFYTSVLTRRFAVRDIIIKGNLRNLKLV